MLEIIQFYRSLDRGSTMRYLAMAWLCLLSAAPAVRTEAADARNPVLAERVSVRPVFIVPRGEAPPTPAQEAKLLRHLEWTREWYRERLPGEVTFRLESEVLTHRSPRPLAQYRQRPQFGRNEKMMWSPFLT